MSYGGTDCVTAYNWLLKSSFVDVWVDQHCPVPVELPVDWPVDGMVFS